MPVYDYRCPKCGSEATHSVSYETVEKFTSTCSCGTTRNKIISVPAVTFKGTGWGKDR